LFNYELDFEVSNKLSDELLKIFNLSHEFSSKLYINENQMSEMSTNGQIFGSHTKEHKILSTLDFKTQLKEIEDSFSDLSNFIYDGFKTISYPFGYKFTYNSDTIKILNDQDVDFGFIFDNKKNQSFKRYEISRIDCNNYIF